VELLVALFVLSLVAVLSWRGLDGMVRTQQITEARANEVQALQVGLAQWTTDLDSLVQLPQLAALDWNGRVLRLTRHSPVAANEGVVVVGWSRRIRDGVPRWTRWQSSPLTSRGQVDEAWARVDAWAQDQAGTDEATAVAVTPLQDWQVFYYRGDAWTNPLSSDATQASQTSGIPPAVRATTAGAQVAQLPDGIRIVLTLPPGQAISGDLTRDWVRPTVSGGKS
jgi:general secretion pathway protein J